MLNILTHPLKKNNTKEAKQKTTPINPPHKNPKQTKTNKKPTATNNQRDTRVSPNNTNKNNNPPSPSHDDNNNNKHIKQNKTNQSKTNPNKTQNNQRKTCTVSLLDI